MATLNEMLKKMLKEGKDPANEEFVPFKKKDDEDGKDNKDDGKKDDGDDKKKDDDDEDDKKKDVKEGCDDDDEDEDPEKKKDDEDDEDDEKDMDESMTVHVEAIKTLFKDQELSEETLTKLGVIFEAAVSALSKEKIATIEESIEAKYKTELTEAIAEIDKSIDKYISYAAVEYMKENVIGIETGIKAELVESFLSGLNTLYKEHYVELPTDKVDVVVEMAAKLKDSEDKLNVIIEANIGYKETINGFKKAEIISEMSKDLADTDKEKFASIIEDIKFEDVESYTAGIKTIKENYMFGDKKVINEEVVIPKKASMDIYMKAISGKTSF